MLERRRHGRRAAAPPLPQSAGDAAASGEVEQEAVLGAGEALRSFMEVRIFGDQSSVKSKDSSISLSLCFCKPA